MPQHRRRITPSLVLSVAALVAASGGTAVAAGELITSPDQVKDRVLTEPKLADGAVAARAVADNGIRLDDLAQPVVATGVNKGIRPGEPPFLINPTREVESVQTAGPNFNNGRYTITFSEPVRHCQWAATAADIKGQGKTPTFFHVSPSTIDTRKVEVFTSKLKTLGSNKGAVIQEPASFYLLGRC